MRYSEAESATETGLKCICVHIHPALDSSRSEDSQLGPAGGITSDRSEHFPSRSHVNIYLSFIDPERGVFGEIFPEVMIFSPREISSLKERFLRIPRVKGL